MKKLLVLLLIGMLTISGCQSTPAVPDADEEIEEPSEVTEGETEEEEKIQEIENEDEDLDTSDYDSIEVSVEDAFDLFIDKYPNAIINQIKLELEYGRYEYEIEGYKEDTEYELKIDAFTKEILKEEEKLESNESGEIKKDQLSKIEEFVKETLEDAGPDYWINEWKLEAKGNYIEFEIELKTDNNGELEYKYNFETGELLEKDQD